MIIKKIKKAVETVRSTLRFKVFSMNIQLVAAAVIIFAVTGILQVQRFAGVMEETSREQNAVIMDTMTGYDEGHEIRYKGLFEGQKLSSPELPFIFYSGFGTDSLGPLGGYIFTNLTSWGNRFVVKTEKESLREAVRARFPEKSVADPRKDEEASVRDTEAVIGG